MRNIKIFGSLFLAMLSCFIIGLYSASTFKYNEPIDSHRWIMTIMFGLYFLVYFSTENKKK